MNTDNSNINSKNSLKIFFIKLISVSIAILILINLIFNLLFAERLEKIDKLLLLEKNEFRHEIKEKMREELRSSLNKDNLIYEEDKILMYKLYQKLKKEFQDIDKSKL
ncbi:MAG: hypothetical protein CMI70_02970 [Candidatus Pelagibacter sp.]|jgi:hypothetical protein|nr:hypothetical protein [Candidatus Pelagibacter sp.]